MAQASDYTSLITSEHADKPKFTAMVTAVAGAFTDATNANQAMPLAFDLDNAIGNQLDTIGLWVGITRGVKSPLSGVYFSFDTAGVGFDQGSWQGPYDPSTGIVSLDDDTYRILIRTKITSNRWDGTLGSAKDIMQGIFPDGKTSIFIQDNQDMTMLVGISGNPPSAIFRALITGGYIPLKPEGVSVKYAVTSTRGAPLFGFDVENQFISGFDVGAFGVPA